MEDILERTPPVRSPCMSNLNQISLPSKNIVPSQTRNIPSPASTTSSHTSNTYVNLQPPPKPPFNHSASLQLITGELQRSAPPKPIPPRSEQLNSLIYTTLKEIQPAARDSKSPPSLDVHEDNVAPNRKFTVTPVASEGCPTPTTYIESISSHSSDSELGLKRSTSAEPVKFITVPEDLVKLDRRSILRARFQKTIDYARRILAFILSHVGLSLMVIGYTILGAVVFCSVEKEGERQTKKQMVDSFKKTITELMELWQFSLYRMITENQNELMRRKFGIQSQGKLDLEGLAWYIMGVGSNEVIPRHWLDSIIAENSSTSFQNLVNSTTSTASILPFESITSPPRITTPSPMNGSYNEDEVLNITKRVADAFKENVTQIINDYVNHVVHAIKDEGWNGASNTDDINWTFEGGVLFAITVYTTIGKLTYNHIYLKSVRTLETFLLN
ncbi:hypothetical protein Aperf_G00000022138 [Anoplocephala perfoliata]